MRCRPRRAVTPQRRGVTPSADGYTSSPASRELPLKGKPFLFSLPTQTPRATSTGDHRSPLQRHETLQRLRSSLPKKKKRQGGQGPPGLADSTEFTASKQGGRKDARNASVPNFYERNPPQTPGLGPQAQRGKGGGGSPEGITGGPVRGPPRFPLARAERCSGKAPPHANGRKKAWLCKSSK